MSLINRMLHDLDARRAGAEERHFPAAVTPLPASLQSRPSSLAWPLAIVLLIAAVAVAWWVSRVGSVPSISHPTTPPPAAPAPPASAVTPKALPPAVDLSLRMDPDLDRVPSPSTARRGSPAPVAAPVTAETKDDKRSTKTPAPAAAGDKINVPPRADAPQAMPGVRPKEVAPREVPQLAAETSIDKKPRPASAAERADAEYRRAVLAQRQGNLEEAVSHLRAALGIQAEHAASRQGLVNILLEAKHYDEAEVLLQQGLELPSVRLSSAMTLARLKVERGQVAAAADVLAANSAAGERSAEFQGFAGALMSRGGRHGEAVERYRAATRLAPNEGRWWAGLGIALEASGKADEARDAFVKARGMPNLPPELAQLVEQRLR